MSDNAPMSGKEKLNELFGITDSQSIDDFLDDLSNQTDELSSAFGAIDENVRENIEKIDANLSALQSGNADDSILVLKNIDLSMKEVENMIDVSKKMFKHVADQILTSTLIDSELIGSAAKLLESIHINLSEFISMYRDKNKYVERIKLMMFDQAQKKELMMLKHKLDLEKMRVKDGKPVDGESADAQFDTDYIIKVMDDRDGHQ